MPTFPQVRDVITRAPITPPPDDTLAASYGFMRQHDVSRLPRVAGGRIVDESNIFLHVYGNSKRFTDSASIAMVTRLELTPADDGLEKLLPIFERGHVAMVAEGEQLVGLLTRVDLPGWLRAVLD